MSQDGKGKESCATVQMDGVYLSIRPAIEFSLFKGYVTALPPWRANIQNWLTGHLHADTSSLRSFHNFSVMISTNDLCKCNGLLALAC